MRRNEMERIRRNELEFTRRDETPVRKLRLLDKEQRETTIKNLIKEYPILKGLYSEYQHLIRVREVPKKEAHKYIVGKTLTPEFSEIPKMTIELFLESL